VNARVVERLREISEMGLEDEDKAPAAEEKPVAARKPARKKTPPAAAG
jgi:hypothetical protein